MAVARSRPFLVGASHHVMAVVRASRRSSAESCVPVLEIRVLLDPLEDALAALGADVVVQDGRYLDEVAVGVDDRVV